MFSFCSRGHPTPKLATTGKYSRQFFNRRGDLRNIFDLDSWGLADVLRQKYKLPKEEADLMASFLLPMLNLSPEKRATAADMLDHAWLSTPPYVDSVKEATRMAREKASPYDKLKDEDEEGSQCSF